MPRRHGPRRGLNPPIVIADPRYRCLGCPEPVSGSRLCCKSCWGRLASAPDGLRDRLGVPPGESPHLYDGHDFRLAVAQAEAYLARVRIPAGGAR